MLYLLATDEMVGLVMRHRQIAFEEALMLVGLLGDARISQIASLTKTARVVMPRSAVYGDELS